MIDATFEHAAKAEFPMLVTDAGMIIEVNALQLKKA